VDGDLKSARAACEQALACHDQLPMPFELGRTMLVKGAIERRAKQKSAARETLGQALSIFEQLSAPLWAAKARSELSKTITRTAGHGLTKTEHRVAALVAKGLTNREIALTMFVTENTVQTHIQHIFQKLGVKSRTELAARILTAPARVAPAASMSSDRDVRPGANSRAAARRANHTPKTPWLDRSYVIFLW
jgi:DNA-binding CsgD family transcriptional regulator